MIVHLIILGQFGYRLLFFMLMSKILLSKLTAFFVLKKFY